MYINKLADVNQKVLAKLIKDMYIYYKKCILLHNTKNTKCPLGIFNGSFSNLAMGLCTSVANILMCYGMRVAACDSIQS